MQKKDLAEQIEERAAQTTTKADQEFYPTGCTLFDLALGGGLGKGTISNIVGDNSTGKTLLACEVIAKNIAIDKKIGHTFDNAESGFTLNTEVVWNFKANLLPQRSTLVEEFQYNVEKVLKSLKEGENHIYVLDSLDGISDEAEKKKHTEKMTRIKKQLETEKDIKGKGDYGAAKAKGMSEFFRLLNSKINLTKMHLMIISQVRENIGIMFGPKFIRSGGKALDFYAGQVAMLAVVEKVESQVKIDKILYKRTTGILIKAFIKKNKLGMPFRTVFIFIDFEYGVDNLKSNIFFLYDLLTPEGKMRKDTGISLEWGSEVFNSVDGLISHIESNNQEDLLRKKVIKRWNEIEENLKPDRKKKY